MSINFGSLWGDDDERDTKRALSTRDKQILLARAHHKCENCGRRLPYEDMQVGHKNAWSKGGSTTLRNSVALCYRCNKLQGTDSWAKFQRKQAKPPVKTATAPKTGQRKRRKKRHGDDDEWGLTFPDLSKLW